MSTLSKAINLVKTRSPHTGFLNQLVRVDQAGELAANYIYWGQHLVFQRTKPELAPMIKHMWEQEIHHHNTFNQMQINGRVRPSLLTPVWKLAAFSLGVSTALKGQPAAMACTEAVETVIGGHYNEQLRYLLREVPDSEELKSLNSLISQFRDDELEHLDIAVNNDAHMAKPYWLLTEIIKNGCKAAIYIAKRI